MLYFTSPLDVKRSLWSFHHEGIRGKHSKINYFNTSVLLKSNTYYRHVIICLLRNSLQKCFDQRIYIIHANIGAEEYIFFAFFFFFLAYSCRNFAKNGNKAGFPLHNIFRAKGLISLRRKSHF